MTIYDTLTAVALYITIGVMISWSGLIVDSQTGDPISEDRVVLWVIALWPLVVARATWMYIFHDK